jgi:hypothetical protein
MSADELVEGFNSQDLNPYTYVRNRPTSAVDPTGQSFVGLDIVVAPSGGGNPGGRSRTGDWGKTSFVNANARVTIGETTHTFQVGMAFSLMENWTFSLSTIGSLNVLFGGLPSLGSLSEATSSIEAVGLSSEVGADGAGSGIYVADNYDNPIEIFTGVPSHVDPLDAVRAELNELNDLRYRLVKRLDMLEASEPGWGWFDWAISFIPGGVIWRLFKLGFPVGRAAAISLTKADLRHVVRKQNRLKSDLGRPPSPMPDRFKDYPPEPGGFGPP